MFLLFDEGQGDQRKWDAVDFGEKYGDGTRWSGFQQRIQLDGRAERGTPRRGVNIHSR